MVQVRGLTRGWRPLWPTGVGATPFDPGCLRDGTRRGEGGVRARPSPFALLGIPLLPVGQTVAGSSGGLGIACRVDRKGAAVQGRT